MLNYITGPGAVSVALYTPGGVTCFGKLSRYSTPDSLMQYGCVHPPVVSHISWPSCCLPHVQYPVAVVTCVLSDNCLLEAPGAFSIAMYTSWWCHMSLGQVVVYGMHSTRWLLSHVFCQIIVY